MELVTGWGVNPTGRLLWASWGRTEARIWCDCAVMDVLSASRPNVGGFAAIRLSGRHGNGYNARVLVGFGAKEGFACFSGGCMRPS